MRIELHNLLPEPMVEAMDWDSEVWRRSLSFEAGRRYQLNAPSGNGKTSLINSLYGLRDNYRGDILLDGRPAREIRLSEWCRLRRVGMAVVFQDLRLFPELTAAENIEIKASLEPAPPSPTRETMLAALGMADRATRPVATLSWGERQRVALIRALSQPFAWLLLDEPFSHLDPGNIAAACDLVEQACEVRKAGLIMTSLGYDYPLNFDFTMKL